MINKEQEIELLNFLKYKIKISDEFIEKSENRIFLDDIVLIKCKTWRQYANYSGARAFHGFFNRIYILDNKKNKIDLSFSSKDEESFNKFGIIIATVIKPLVSKTTEKIRSGADVNIYKLSFTNNGIYKKGFFGKKFIDWKECSGARLERGYLNIYRNSGKKFCSIFMWKDNAILIPEIVKQFKH